VTVVHDIGPEWRGGITPEVVVVHYGVTHTLDALVAAQKARNFKAHFSIDSPDNRDLRITQLVRYGKRGTHAGKSAWTFPSGKTINSLNSYSTGIEISNPGPLEEKDGKLFTVYGKEWPREDAVEVEPEQRFGRYRFWAKYSPGEIALVTAIALACNRRHPVKDILGHHEISPGRKIDPGPAFPLDWVRSFVNPPKGTTE